MFPLSTTTDRPSTDNLEPLNADCISCGGRRQCHVGPEATTRDTLAHEGYFAEGYHEIEILFVDAI